MDQQLNDQITTLIQVHDAVEGRWLEEVVKTNLSLINFNKKQIKHIDTDLSILEYIYKYRNFLAKFASNINLVLALSDIQRTRVKEVLSISGKIRRMGANTSVGNGSVPINKVLNDLYGARVIREEDFDYDCLTQEIKETYGDRVKVINSCNEAGYKAVHVYFREKRGHFPWELQIWRKSDEDNNIALHKEYKRDYINELKELGNLER